MWVREDVDVGLGVKSCLRRVYLFSFFVAFFSFGVLGRGVYEGCRCGFGR
jgi:hypothetical protein